MHIAQITSNQFSCAREHKLAWFAREYLCPHVKKKKVFEVFIEAVSSMRRVKIWWCGMNCRCCRGGRGSLVVCWRASDFNFVINVGVYVPSHVKISMLWTKKEETCLPQENFESNSIVPGCHAAPAKKKKKKKNWNFPKKKEKKVDAWQPVVLIDVFEFIFRWDGPVFKHFQKRGKFFCHLVGLGINVFQFYSQMAFCKRKKKGLVSWKTVRNEERSCNHTDSIIDKKHDLLLFHVN